MSKRMWTFFCVLFCTIFLVNAKTVKVGYLKNLGNLMSGDSEDDEKYGFAYEYLQSIAAYTGWTYEYKYGFFDELYEDLLAGEIDLLPNVSYSEDKKNLVNFPDYAMGSKICYLYANMDNTNVSSDDFSTLEGKSLSLGSGLHQYELFSEWQKKHNINFETKILPFDQVTHDLLNNQIDDLYLAFDLESESNWEPIVKIGSSDIYLGVSRDRRDILDELNGALNSIYVSNPHYTNNLWSQYFSYSAMTKRLSQKEKNWISKKQKITVGCLVEDQPYAGINKKTGKAEGLVVYMMDHLISLFDLENVSIDYKFYESVSKIYKAIANNEIDIAFPLIYNAFEAENRKISLSRKVLSGSMGFVHTKDNELTDSDLVIAIPEGRRSEDFLLQLSILEDDELETFENSEACLNAVLNNEVEGAIFNLNQIQNIMYGRRKYSKLFTTEFSEQMPLCFAMNRESTELLSIMNKVIANVSDAEIQNVIISSSLNGKNYSVRNFMADYWGLILSILVFVIVILIALAISLSYLKILINYDTLTHLLNRRSLNPYLKTALNRLKSHGEIFSIMIFDLDNFKHINDTYGHACGDEVLKMAAETISMGVKHRDAVFRWGGEEFLVLIKADKETSVSVADKIRQDIQKKVVVYGKEKISITATIGVATANEKSTVKDIFVIADNNLYKGKNNGKNQVVSD